MINPVELAKAIEKVVTLKRDGEVEKRYYRFRGDRWYGGIATADAVGCNLSCGFCWSWRANAAPASAGAFYPPGDVAGRIVGIAKSRGYRLLRVSGGEPTIGFDHLLQVLDHLRGSGYIFILETNGILIGHDRSCARGLSEYDFVHVRVSIKGASEEEFSALTGAEPQGFRLQLESLRNLLDEGVSHSAAAMLSFSSEESKRGLLDRLREIDARLADELEEEYVILYPHVVELMKRRGLKPRASFHPSGIPVELV